MNKIIIIGCPGSGKSILSFKLEEILNLPVLHLDKIYHIDNEHRISKEEFMAQVEDFANLNEKWIIDGNHISTIEQRINFADTIILLDIDTEICIQNAIARSKKERQKDMAEGFDISKLDDTFLDYIGKFKETTMPKIMEYYNKYKDKKNFIILKNYEEIDDFIKKLKELI